MRKGSIACQSSLRERLGRSGISRSPPETSATGLMRRCATRPIADAIHTARSCFERAVDVTDIDADVSTKM